ncbi:peptidase inhibitor family I36 protein [Streptomyces sp. TS71-3]|uniref:peptidase inhibitor family I36 protein n=1 Tax=Streptomyces sp. TS71-3 TaxID=2733862 RepID=UPI001B09388F|nr:peptidase inhibitor family I36 protein [Streptomyces sp. TS71-3]GHJ36596.1 hypothetical protein Sm713_22050 [Streptomyces sp. TS71-3]
MHSLRRSLTALATTTALAAIATAGVTETASASACPSGAVCAYQDLDWRGVPGPLYGDNQDLTPYYQWTTANSIYNNGTRCDVYIYSYQWYRGTRYALNRGTGWKSLNGSAIQESALSNKWFNCS